MIYNLIIVIYSTSYLSTETFNSRNISEANYGDTKMEGGGVGGGGSQRQVKAPINM